MEKKAAGLHVLLESKIFFRLQNGTAAGSGNEKSVLLQKRVSHHTHTHTQCVTGLEILEIYTRGLASHRKLCFASCQNSHRRSATTRKALKFPWDGQKKTNSRRQISLHAKKERFRASLMLLWSIDTRVQWKYRGRERKRERERGRKRGQTQAYQILKRPGMGIAYGRREGQRGGGGRGAWIWDDFSTYILLDGQYGPALQLHIQPALSSQFLLPLCELCEPSSLQLARFQKPVYLDCSWPKLLFQKAWTI